MFTKSPSRTRVVAWLLIQIATQTFPFFDIPSWAIRLVILLVVIASRHE